MDIKSIGREVETLKDLVSGVGVRVTRDLLDRYGVPKGMQRYEAEYIQFAALLESMRNYIVALKSILQSLSLDFAIFENVFDFIPREITGLESAEIKSAYGLETRTDACTYEQD